MSEDRKQGMKEAEHACPVQCRAGSTYSKALTFADLEVGDRFIWFPADGDDHGHGGLKGGSHLFVKTKAWTGEYAGDNAINIKRGVGSAMTGQMDVIKVL